MAKIEMDVSEYEAMKEVKKLLEDSLEKERGLSEEIKTLQQEKLDALDKAKHQVVKIVKTSSEEYIYKKVPRMGGDITYSLITALDNVIRDLKSGRRNSDDVLDHLQDRLFEKTKVEGPEIVHYETSQSITDLKADERRKAKIYLKEEYEEKIEEAEKAISKHRQIAILYDELRTESVLHSDMTRDLKEEVEDWRGQVEILEKYAHDVHDAAVARDRHINTILGEWYGLFSNKLKIKKLKKLMSKSNILIKG
jgi:hypothetical protein